MGLIQSVKRFLRAELRFLRRRNSPVDNSFTWCPGVPFCPSWSTLPVSPRSHHSYVSQLYAFLNLSPVGSASPAELWLRTGGCGQKEGRGLHRGIKEEEQAAKVNTDRGVDLTVLPKEEKKGKKRKDKKLSEDTESSNERKVEKVGQPHHKLTLLQQL